jgi:hypothetical protein
MKTLSPAWKHARTAYLLVALCSVAYVLLSIWSPSSTADRLYHLTNLQKAFLQLSILGPAIVIWFVALTGAVTFRRYAVVITGGAEAQGLRLISVGLLWLVVYVVTLSLSGAALPYFMHSSWLPTLITIRNHLPVLSSLIAFGLICWGTHKLRASAQFKVWTATTTVLLIVMAAVAGLFVWAFLTITPEPGASGIPQYTLPPQVLVFTVVLPYCWAWFMGLLAALNIVRFARRVKGVIYRQALRDLAAGIAVVVALVALLQLVVLSNRFLIQLSLGALLLLVYGLLAIMAVGFWYVRSGARKLMKIEVAQ